MLPYHPSSFNNKNKFEIITIMIGIIIPIVKLNSQPSPDPTPPTKAYRPTYLQTNNFGLHNQIRFQGGPTVADHCQLIVASIIAKRTVSVKIFKKYGELNQFSRKKYFWNEKTKKKRFVKKRKKSFNHSDHNRIHPS